MVARCYSAANPTHSHITQVQVQMALTEENFPDVLSALWVARERWFFIGTQLRLKVADLTAIKHESGPNLENKLVNMILSWLRSGENCTWRALIEALKHQTVNFPVLAKEIETKFGSNESENYFVQCIKLWYLLSMQMDTVCFQTGILVHVGGNECADNDTSTDVTSKESATSTDLNESSDKHLITYDALQI